MLAFAAVIRAFTHGGPRTLTQVTHEAPEVLEEPEPERRPDADAFLASIEPTPKGSPA